MESLSMLCNLLNVLQIYATFNMAFNPGYLGALQKISGLNDTSCFDKFVFSWLRERQNPQKDVRF